LKHGYGWAPQPHSKTLQHEDYWSVRVWGLHHWIRQLQVLYEVHVG